MPFDYLMDEYNFEKYAKFGNLTHSGTRINYTENIWAYSLRVPSLTRLPSPNSQDMIYNVALSTAPNILLPIVKIPYNPCRIYWL